MLIIIALILPQGFNVSTALAEESTNIILKQGFEDDTIGDWGYKSWGTSGDISISTDQAAEGSKSLLFSNRVSSDSHPSLNLTNYMKSDRIYDVSLKVRLGEGEGTYRVASKVESPLLDNKYPWMIGNQTVNATGWTTFEYQGYEVPSSTSEFLIWLEPDSANSADIYIDEVLIIDVTPDSSTPDQDDLDQSGLISDFEDGTKQGWVARNGSDAIEVTAADNHTVDGASSLLTGASSQYQGPLLDVLGNMHKGHIYELSVWVKMAPGQESSRIRLSVQSGSDGPYTNVSANETITDQEWVQLKGQYTLATNATVLNAYVELADEPGEVRAFYIDDFTLTHVGSVTPPPPIQTDIPSLREVYADYFKIGAAVENTHLSGSQKELLDYHYNSLVAENVMKPEYMSKSVGDYNWENGDVLANYVRAYNEANDTKFDLRFHTLVWHSQGSDWMLKDNQGNWLEPNAENKQLVLERMTDYIHAAVERYGDIITDWDVVNEVIDPGRPNGMRDSHWYRITGKDFIRTAFIETRKALDANGYEGKLYINDYSTHNPQKRDFLYDLVVTLKAEGVPIDGVGHQTHINITGPSIQQISDSIKKFGQAGFDNQITELDISVYTNNSDSYDTVPEEILVKQGYRYKELFDEFIRLDEMGKTEANPEGWISNVTLWGIADNHTWLHNRGTTRQDAPFPFDKQYQAKHAYWGMVDPSKLPVYSKTGNTAQGTPVIDEETDLVWSTVPAMTTDLIGTLQANIKTLWDKENLYVHVTVQDATNTDGDQIELFVDNNGIESVVIPRSAETVVEVDGGYVVEKAIPLNGNELGPDVKFDVRVTDMGANDGLAEHSGNGSIVSWSDPRNAQHSDSEGYGVLTLVEATKLVDVRFGTPVIDGEQDGIWNATTPHQTDVWVEGSNGATAQFHTLWDEHNLYVYAVITDSLLSASSDDAWQQDSLEIFIDQNNGKTTNYGEDDGQYRINFNNERSVGGHASLDNFTSFTKVTETGYIVEAAFALDTITPTAGTLLGFDLQVNNDENGNGSRDSVATWNDPTGASYMDTSRLGVLRLIDVPLKKQKPEKKSKKVKKPKKE